MICHCFIMLSFSSSFWCYCYCCGCCVIPVAHQCEMFIDRFVLQWMLFVSAINIWWHFSHKRTSIFGMNGICLKRCHQDPSITQTHTHRFMTHWMLYVDIRIWFIWMRNLRAYLLDETEWTHNDTISTMTVSRKRNYMKIVCCSAVLLVVGFYFYSLW